MPPDDLQLNGSFKILKEVLIRRMEEIEAKIEGGQKATAKEIRSLRETFHSFEVSCAEKHGKEAERESEKIQKVKEDLNERIQKVKDETNTKITGLMVKVAGISVALGLGGGGAAGWIFGG